MAIQRICSIPDCGKPRIARGWCSAHYYRWQRNGDPLGGQTAKGETLRFINEVALFHNGDECLKWPYATTVEGYGILTMGGSHHLAHRLICEKVKGPPPDPTYDAAHSCGKGHLGCVNPRHLSWKTRADNLADMIAHGTILRGVRRWNAKLTEDAVREIRSLRGKVMQTELAQRFGVSVSLISQTQSGKNWAWLE